jgi:hypothetical protein
MSSSNHLKMSTNLMQSWQWALGVVEVRVGAEAEELS